ncbi:MAG: xanthine dehydrogenase family protein molybdopterin-binding subunit, partial [Anaerolineae bacterium]
VAMAMRGFGSTQAAFAYEMQMNKLAEALKMDPVELRMKNLLEDGSLALTGNPMPPGVGVKETLRQTALAAGWKEEEGGWIKPDLGPPSAPYRRRGIGVACGYKNVGYSFGFDDKSKVIVELALDESGEIARALVKLGASDQGMGAHTALAQIAAEALGIDYEKVRVALVDTSVVPNAGSCSASRHVYMSGNAVIRACQEAVRKRQEALRRGERRVSAEYEYHGRSVRPTTPYDDEDGMCNPHISYGYTSQIALVEVDVETGQTEVLKVWAAQDVGKAINPEMVKGQAGGGVHMGLGYALTEEFIQKEGLVKTRRFSEYHIPTVVDMPREFMPFIVEVPDPTGPFGAKGVGEMTTLPTAPAIISAIHDAVGVWIDNLPATAEKVWRAMQSKS